MAWSLFYLKLAWFHFNFWFASRFQAAGTFSEKHYNWLCMLYQVLWALVVCFTSLLVGLWTLSVWWLTFCRPEVGAQPYGEETKRTPSLKDRSAADQHKVTEAASPTEIVPSAEGAKVGGLVPSDSWADAGTPVKKVTRTDSQKKEKRQRTLSLKTKKPTTVYRPSDAVPSVELEGILERKHEYQSGGKIATIRTWKNYYTILCGQLLCFFRDKQGLHMSFLCDLFSNCVIFNTISGHSLKWSVVIIHLWMCWWMHKSLCGGLSSGQTSAVYFSSF